MTSTRAEPAASRSQTSVPPTKPAPPVTSTETSLNPRMRLLRRLCQMGICLCDASRAIVLDGSRDPVAKRGLDAPLKVLTGLRRIEQDGKHVVRAARPDLDRGIEL